MKAFERLARMLAFGGLFVVVAQLPFRFGIIQNHKAYLPSKNIFGHFLVSPVMVAWVVAKTFDYFYIAAENCARL